MDWIGWFCLGLAHGFWAPKFLSLCSLLPTFRHVFPAPGPSCRRQKMTQSRCPLLLPFLAEQDLANLGLSYSKLFLGNSWENWAHGRLNWRIWVTIFSLGWARKFGFLERKWLKKNCKSNTWFLFFFQGFSATPTLPFYRQKCWLKATLRAWKTNNLLSRTALCVRIP